MDSTTTNTRRTTRETKVALIEKAYLFSRRRDIQPNLQRFLNKVSLLCRLMLSNSKFTFRYCNYFMCLLANNKKTNNNKKEGGQKAATSLRD